MSCSESKSTTGGEPSETATKQSEPVVVVAATDGDDIPSLSCGSTTGSSDCDGLFNGDWEDGAMMSEELSCDGHGCCGCRSAVDVDASRDEYYAARREHSDNEAEDYWSCDDETRLIQFAGRDGLLDGGDVDDYDDEDRLVFLECDDSDSGFTVYSLPHESSTEDLLLCAGEDRGDGAETPPSGHHLLLDSVTERVFAAFAQPGDVSSAVSVDGRELGDASWRVPVTTPTSPTRGHRGFRRRCLSC